jgi:hypothetical protein
MAQGIVELADSSRSGLIDCPLSASGVMKAAPAAAAGSLRWRGAGLGPAIAQKKALIFDLSIVHSHHVPRCSGEGRDAVARCDGDRAREPSRDGEKRPFPRSVGCPLVTTGRCSGPGRGRGTADHAD